MGEIKNLLQNLDNNKNYNNLLLFLLYINGYNIKWIYVMSLRSYMLQIFSYDQYYKS